VELEAAEYASGFGGSESAVQRRWGVGREVVQDDADSLSLGIVLVGTLR